MKRLLSALLAVAVCATAPMAVADDEEEEVDSIDAILDARFADDPEYGKFKQEWAALEAKDPDGEDKEAWQDLVARRKQWCKDKLEKMENGPKGEMEDGPEGETENGAEEEIDEELVEALKAVIDDDDEDEDAAGDDDGGEVMVDGADSGAGDADGSEDIPKMPPGFVEEAAANLTLDAAPDPTAGCR